MKRIFNFKGGDILEIDQIVEALIVKIKEMRAAGTIGEEVANAYRRAANPAFVGMVVDLREGSAPDEPEPISDDY